VPPGPVVPAAVVVVERTRAVPAPVEVGEEPLAGGVVDGGLG